jgi:hypothetical protein
MSNRISGAAQRRAAPRSTETDGVDERVDEKVHRPALAILVHGCIVPARALRVGYGRRVLTPWRPRVPQCGFPLAT